MEHYARVAGLPVEIEAVELDRLELPMAQFVRATTVVRLRGGGAEGIGEDVVYDARVHEAPPPAAIERRWSSFDDLSEALGRLDLFAEEPPREVDRNYRRWAWESAALDLALRQAGRSLADALGIELRPVSFVLSFRLREDGSPEPVPSWLRHDPSLRFKLDPTRGWTPEVIEMLAATGAVAVADLKGAYRGTPVDNPPDPELYRRVAEAFPEAWIEDPDLEAPGTAEALAEHQDRITWDAPIHSVADVEALPFPPRTLNVKPSRFGSVRALLDAFDYCEANGIGTYGGGQFELGPGRGQIEYLAALFSPEASNDVAPAVYHGAVPGDGLPRSPLPPAVEPVGFRWGEAVTLS